MHAIFVVLWDKICRSTHVFICYHHTIFLPNDFLQSVGSAQQNILTKSVFFFILVVHEEYSRSSSVSVLTTGEKPRSRRALLTDYLHWRRDQLLCVPLRMRSNSLLYVEVISVCMWINIISPSTVSEVFFKIDMGVFHINVVKEFRFSATFMYNKTYFI